MLAYRKLLYSYRRYQGNWAKCFYCLRPRTSEDHVLPTSIARALPFINWPAEILLIVPCCTECNSIAGARVFTTIEAKVDYIRGRLRYKLMQLYLERLRGELPAEILYWREGTGS